MRNEKREKGEREKGREREGEKLKCVWVQGKGRRVKDNVYGNERVREQETDREREGERERERAWRLDWTRSCVTNEQSMSYWDIDPRQGQRPRTGPQQVTYIAVPLFLLSTYSLLCLTSSLHQSLSLSARPWYLHFSTDRHQDRHGSRVIWLTLLECGVSRSYSMTLTTFIEKISSVPDRICCYYYDNGS